MFLARVKKLKVGDPKKTQSNLGAIVSKKHLESILCKIEEAKNDGGKIVLGGKQVFLDGDLQGGYYMLPTVIENTKNTDQINQKEVFGPVATILPFNNEQEAVELCNGVKYGLSASIFSSNISKAHRVAAAVDAGVVWVNTWLLRDLRIPFGGMKHSGFGREGGKHSLEFFTETKNVCVKIENGGNK
jgi:aminomuconate-semialdehyde/2-hydroxymuconate-6-semialdehyde dehydrogenase